MINKIKIKGKKAEGTPIWIIIALVLGLLVLVMMAFGFTKGWGNLWTKMTDWTGGSGTASSLGQTCTIACAQSDKNSYCIQQRSAKGLTDTQVVNLASKAGKTYTIVNDKVMEGPAVATTVKGSKDNREITALGNCQNYKDAGIIAISETDCSAPPVC